MKVTFRAFKDGRGPLQFVQPVSPRGVPRCVMCGKPIPVAYRRYYQQAGKRRFFHADRCAIDWAEWVAEELYPSLES
jgi:endogenous inhibitor of DNA gyrase (YacG/DUF329 family)